jgi:hypothetical protein
MRLCGISRLVGLHHAFRVLQLSASDLSFLLLLLILLTAEPLLVLWCLQSQRLWLVLLPLFVFCLFL